MRAAAGYRGHERPDRDPPRGGGDRGKRDPGVGHAAHGFSVGDVVPHEEAIPAPLLGASGELRHQTRLGQLLEGSNEDAVARVQGARQTGSVFSWLMNGDSAYCGVPASSIAG